MADPEGVVTQECLNEHPLTRASDDGGASPIDPSFPGRYYIDPECRAGETFQDMPAGAPSGYNIRMRYVLPDIECAHCVMQMVYCKREKRAIGFLSCLVLSWAVCACVLA